jgi:D-glycero-alpha-D-manno-heptose-7-phosphate kinase
MGGTLDIRSLSLALGYLSPSTVNMALTLRTRVTLLPFDPGMIRVSSKGFDSAAYPLDSVSFYHPLGLMFAVAGYFRAEGVHVVIESSSPPRSALGGSSVAAVALTAALDAALVRLEEGIAPLDCTEIALLAHALEESVAGVPCGTQDQLAAAFGGVNTWRWQAGAGGQPFERMALLAPEAMAPLSERLLVAYCGVPHESKDVNTRWLRQFLTGETRARWRDIVCQVHRFEAAIGRMDIPAAIDAMEREMAHRRQMTPDVLDDMGRRLAAAAGAHGCGARIAGAGAGGCLWALGQPERIDRLRPAWQEILRTRKDAALLDARIDPEGVRIEAP